MSIRDEILIKLNDLKDDKYREFTSKLFPTIDKGNVLGVRTPQLRLLVNQLIKDDRIDEFLNDLPHKYLEENHLHGYLIEQIKDYDECIKEINKFLPYVDNWVTCDTMRPKCFKNNVNNLLKEIKLWLNSGLTYSIRFAIEMLMVYFLDDAFNCKYLQWVADVKSDEYYVKMMVAWYFATALAKQYDESVKYLKGCKLEQWTHNKTIQKAIESYRITKEQKDYLKTLKQK